MSGSPPPPPPVVVAVGGIAVVEGALLLVQRGTAPERGRWTVPGGRVEPGESVTAAVERELFEETALEVRCGAFLGWVERRSPDHHFVILDFRVTTAGRGRPQAGGDAADVAWVAGADVGSLPLVEGLEAFLTEHAVLEGRPSRSV